MMTRIVVETCMTEFRVT